jgi:hypothetical protein
MVCFFGQPPSRSTDPSPVRRSTSCPGPLWAGGGSGSQVGSLGDPSNTNVAVSAGRLALVSPGALSRREVLVRVRDARAHPSTWMRTTEGAGVLPASWVLKQVSVWRRDAQVIRRPSPCSLPRQWSSPQPQKFSFSPVKRAPLHAWPCVALSTTYQRLLSQTILLYAPPTAFSLES